MKAFIILLALAIIGAHIWFSRELHQDDNERILKKALSSELQQKFGDDISINYNYIDGILEGTVADQTTSDAVEAFAKEKRLAGRIINDLSIAGGNDNTPTPPTESDPSPASLYSQWDGKILKLRGKVASESIKTNLASAANFVGAETVLNEIEVAENVTQPSWSASMPEFLGLFFSGAESGEVEIEDSKIRLEREVFLEQDKTGLLAEVGKWGLTIDDQIQIAKVSAPKQEVIQPPKEIEMRKGSLLASLKKGSLTLTGLVPDDATKSMLGSEASATGFSVVNNIEVGENVESLPWKDSIKGYMQDFFKGASAGELAINADQIRIKREIPHLRRKTTLAEKAQQLLPGVSLSDQLRFAKPAPKFEYGVSQEGKKLNLTGWLPSLELKNKIVEATKSRYPDYKINDQLYVSPNVNMPNWGRGIPKFTGKLPDWDGWDRLQLSGDGIDFTGFSDSSKAKLGKIANGCFDKGFPKVELPKPPEVVKPEPKPAPSKPARLLAVLKDNQLKITGQVPTKELKSSIGKEVSKSLPGVKIENSLTTNKDEIIKPSWNRDVAKMLSEFLATNPATAELEIDDKGLRLKQELADESAKTEWVNKANSITGNFVNQLTVTPPPPPPAKPEPTPPPIPEPTPPTTVVQPTAPPKEPEPATELVEIDSLPKYYIYFDTNSYWVKQYGIDQVQAAVDASKKIKGKNPIFVVQGFADSRGDQYANQALSEQRAGSVVYLLNSKGISSESIKVSAMGESQSWGRGNQQWDRRVEITLKQ